MKEQNIWTITELEYFRGTETVSYCGCCHASRSLKKTKNSLRTALMGYFFDAAKIDLDICSDVLAKAIDEIIDETEEDPQSKTFSFGNDIVVSANRNGVMEYSTDALFDDMLKDESYAAIMTFSRNAPIRYEIRCYFNGKLAVVYALQKTLLQ